MAAVRPKSLTPVSPKQVRCVDLRRVVSFPKFHYHDLLPTSCGLVGRVANKSTTRPQQVGNLGEVTEKRVQWILGQSTNIILRCWNDPSL